MMNDKKNSQNINPDDFFPTILSVKDNKGNEKRNPMYGEIVESQKVLTDGDVIEIECEATDPYGTGLFYQFAINGQPGWSDKRKSSLLLNKENIGRNCVVDVKVKSNQDFHAYSDFDAWVRFRYIVVPHSNPKK